MEQWQIDRAARNAREAAELKRSIQASAERLAAWGETDVEEDTEGRRYKIMGKFILRGQTAHFLIAQLEPLDDDVI